MNMHVIDLCEGILAYVLYALLEMLNVLSLYLFQYAVKQIEQMKPLRTLHRIVIVSDIYL